MTKFMLQYAANAVILKKSLIIINFLQINFFTIMNNDVNDLKLDHEFSAGFRQEIAGNRLKGVIAGLVDSKSSKLPLKKMFLARECKKKKSFRVEVEKAIASLCKERPQMALAYTNLKAEII